jgi:S1-C subfamily serine protease
MIRRSGQMGVPVITVDDEVIVGFNRQRLEEVLLRHQRARPALGVKVAGAAALARKRGLELPAGAYVGRVTAGSAAERAGLREGDVILTLNGKAVHGASDVAEVLGALPAGQRGAEVVWWRDGQEMRAQLLLS